MHSLRTRAIAILLVLAALASLTHWIPERLVAQETIESEALSANPRFGLCFVSSAEDPADQARYERARSSGATWTRYPFYWQNIEKIAGQFDYSRHDQVVSADVQNGLRPLAILMGTAGSYATSGFSGNSPRVEEKLLPLLASGRIEATDLRAWSAASPPRNLNQPVFSDGTDLPGSQKRINPHNPWANFVFQTVERYKPGGILATSEEWTEGEGISHWEIWNEPDWSFFWNGSVEQYYRLLQVAYLAAKHADPQCTVILGGLATYFNPDWFPRLLNVMDSDPHQEQRASSNHYFDAIAVHFYSRSADAYDHIVRIRNLLTAHGLEKPIWVTESGVPVWNDYPGPTWAPDSPYRATKDEQAAYVIQAHAYALYLGAEVIFHFQLHDDCGNGPDAHDAYGLFRNPQVSVCYPSDAAPRPSYQAYKVAAEQFRGLKPLWRQTPDNDHELIAFYREGAGQRVITMWATKGHDVDAHIAALAEAATLIDMHGNATTIEPTQGYYTVRLPKATNQNLPTDPTAYMIGGPPFILVEKAPLIAASDLIYNGSFEAGLLGWQGSGSTAPQLSNDCLTGEKCVVLGKDFTADPGLPDNPYGGNSTVYQELIVDPGVVDPELHFAYKLETEETEQGSDWFETLVIALESDSTATATYLISPRELYQPCDWTQASFSLAPWKGKRVRVVFNVYQSSAEKPTLAWVDDVSIRSAAELNQVILPFVWHGAKRE